ncbi:MAG: glycerophosphodiester phosphodiesterase [Ignavibacteria bacterium]|nr:glycerophosphodiester phosphodiesterase [Ignavibacteria bacterium]
MTRALLLGLALLALASCGDIGDVVMPQPDPAGLLAGSVQLPTFAGRRLDGVYTVSEGRQRFGAEVVLKWNGSGLSIFSGKDAVLCIMGAGLKDSALVFAGTWRNVTGLDAGSIALSLDPAEGGIFLLRGQEPKEGDIILRGAENLSTETQRKPVVLSYKRPLHKGARPFQIIGHRAGARNSDSPPAVENSVELALLCERFGATGIEIDVQLTKDGVPVVFHDEYLNLRLNQKSGLVGQLGEYTFAQLETFARLKNGERIPSLRRMLSSVLHGTTLSFVWLDSKPTIPIALLQKIQREYLDSARVLGRDLTIALGLPTVEKVEEYLLVPGASKAPVLCELSLDDVRRTNAAVWAPRWTLGTQSDAVAQMHAEGRRAVVWTLDLPGYIQQFVREGDFDGILTNYTSLVAYHYYVQP